MWLWNDAGDRSVDNRKLAVELSEIKQVLRSLRSDEGLNQPRLEDRANMDTRDLDVIRNDISQQIRAAIQQEFAIFQDDLNNMDRPEKDNAATITPEQEQLFYELQEQIHTPVSGKRLTMIDLSQGNVVNRLTVEQHKQLVSELVMGVNRGEFAFEEVFPNLAEGIESGQ